MLACILLEAFALLMLSGPKMLGVQSLRLIFVGLAMNGFAIAGVFVPIIPMLVSAVKGDYLASHEDLISDLRGDELESAREDLVHRFADSASSLQAIFSGLFAFIAPIISGSLADHSGYKSATNFMASLALVSWIMVFFTQRKTVN